ncbi:energy-coupling factor ABC transporter permease [Ferrimonas balearica]|uniref:energy-coupling factor ABC transporter permease n=1 Tax=Ferrimonas balearica TaxID=44012 RepID=UPI001C9984FA|nr:energy-coupling factor ABC transporter permease [Ferrimonas balearica]MBY5993825.1 energy-coupling factor ABC transporter permease [Ferrimonas balearica]
MNLLLCLAFFALLAWTFKASALAQRWRDSRYLNLAALCAVGILALWRVRAGIYEGLDLHFLGLTVLTLMFGWRSALLLASLAQGGLLLLGVDQWENAAGLFWLGVALPVMGSFAWLTLCHNLLPRNLWVYVFVGAFMNGALIFALRTLGLGLWYSGQYDWPLLMDNYLILIPLFIFPEAMLNGFSTTMMVVYKPNWLATWNEREYLTGPK